LILIILYNSLGIDPDNLLFVSDSETLYELLVKLVKIVPDNRLWDKSSFGHDLICIPLEIIPVRRLYDNDKSFRELLNIPLFDGKVPVRLFPDKCKTCNLGNDQIQSGMPPLMD